MHWQDQIESPLRCQLAADDFWGRYFSGDEKQPMPRYSMHLGVFVEPYLRLILNGRKSVESRFSVARQPPWGRVHGGDVLLMKRSGGPIVGIGLIDRAWSYELDSGIWATISKRFQEPLAMDEAVLWEKLERAAFATLMRLSQVRALSPFAVSKRDRRGWVVLRSSIDLAGDSE